MIEAVLFPWLKYPVWIYRLKSVYIPSLIEAYRQENSELKDKVVAQDEKISAQEEEMSSQKDEIVELKTRMKRLERLIIKMSKEDK